MKIHILTGFIIIIALLISCSDDGDVINNIYHNYYTSLDSNWVRTNGPYQTSIWYPFVSSKNTLLVKARFTFWRSTDNGLSWNEISADSSANNRYAIKEDSEGNLYFLDLVKGLYKSTDDGLSWFKLQSAADLTQTVPNSYLLNFNVGYSGDIYIVLGWYDASDAPYYYNGIIYQSTDGGNSWNKFIKGSEQLGHVYSVYPVKDGSIYALQVNSYDATSSNFLYNVCYCGGTDTKWQIHKDKIKRFSSTTLFFIIDDYGNLFVNSPNLMKSIDHGKTFNLSNSGIYSSINFLALSEKGYLYCSTDNSDLYRSTNSGLYWESLITDLPGIYDIASSPEGYIYFILSSSVLYRSREANKF